MASATPTSMLTDAMLKRFADRAPGYDRENRFFDGGLQRDEAGRLPHRAVPRELGGGGLTFAQMMHEQRRLAYYAHATALGHQHAPLLDGRRRRPLAGRRQVARVAADRRGQGRGLRRRPRREGATTSPCFCRPRRPSAVEGRVSLHRPQALREPHPGVDLPRPPRPGHERPGRSEGRPRLHAAEHRGLQHQGHVGRARHARHREPRHGPRGRGRARPVHRPGGAGGVRGRRPLHPGHLPVGAHRLRQCLLRSLAAAARPARWRA